MNLNAKQRVYKILGENACYQLCLTRIAERVLGLPIDDYKVFVWGVTSGVIGEDCYIFYAARLLEHLTVDKWEVRKERPEYKCKENEFEIQRWEWEEVITGKTIVHSHFILPDYDPLEPSETVKNGKMVSKRICRRITNG